MSVHELAQAETFVQLAHQNQTTVAGSREPWKSTFNKLLNES
jgi:hypothetical protein